MVLNISQTLLYWVTVELFFYFIILFLFFLWYLSCCDISCGQGVEQLPKGKGYGGGGGFVFGLNFLSERKPLGAL